MGPAKLIVVGQGYVGLPLALRAVEAGYEVVGFDRDVDKVKRLADGDSYVEDVPNGRLTAALASGRYLPSDDAFHLADFDVAVVPSVYADPLPRAVIESMALGKPVIAFGVGGVAEMLDDGITGEVVAFSPDESGRGASPGSVRRLAGALVTYAVDRERRAKQGAAARSRVVRSFDAREHARVVEAEILAACRTEPR